MTQYNEKKKIEDTIKVFIGNYHQEINTLNQITKCISSAYVKIYFIMLFYNIILIFFYRIYPTLVLIPSTLTFSC